jgi:hypothetical protein
MLREPGAPPVDEALLKRLEAADRKAIVFVLTDPDMWKHGLTFANQFTNVWPGALAWLRLHPDDNEVRSLLDKRVKDSAAFQSPAGYFYEADGPDWSYNLGTHHSNLRAAYFYARGTPLGKTLIEEERQFIEWLSYNAVPDGNEWVLNRAVETRKRYPVIHFGIEPPLMEEVPLARAFVASREEMAKRVAQERRELERSWPKVAPLQVGDFSAFSPYNFLHREDHPVYPTESERRWAAARVPVNRLRDFIEQRKDPRFGVTYTFVRRPGYYAAFNSGKRIRPQQRYGLGLIWAEGIGALMQSQTGSAGEAWGTRASGAPQVYEAGDLDAKFGPAASEYSVEYPLGTAGRKRLVFVPGAIRVTVEHPGRFTEQIPMLRPEVPAGVTVDTAATKTLRRADKVTVLELAGQDRMEYTIRFAAK